MRVMAIVGVLSLAVAGCSEDGGEGATTSTLGDPVTTLLTAAVTPSPAPGTQGTSSTVPPAGSTATSTTRPVAGFPLYEIAFRGEGEQAATVVIVLDPASYSTLSDIDIQSVIRDVYDLFPPVVTAHVVDSPEAVELVVVDRSFTEEELTLLDQHYLARLEDGIRIVYLGPFEDFPIAILGS